MIDREFINSLSPVELEFISGYIYSLVKEKVTPDTDNHENMDAIVCCCPEYGLRHIVRNGFNPKHRQKYLCKDCGCVFLSTTHTLFSRSRISYEDWTGFIAGEINGLTLGQLSVQISRSLTTCFNMRHKLYRSIKQLIDSQRLSNEVKMDCTYHKINLKGTRPENMPRYSKTRGKSDAHNAVRGISSHKVCIFTAIDSNDNIMASIAALGSEKFEDLKPFGKHFAKNCTVVSDSKESNAQFVKFIKGNTAMIPSGKHLTKDGRHIEEINQIHSELRQLNRAKKGISTRHLPDYLNWYCFIKKLKYAIEPRRRKVQTYMDIMKSAKELRNSDICTIEMPIDLYKAYGEYHYGIYADRTVS